ncbi:hypothetical protein NCLIV_057940 [Neospora caninum Liverpool]|uniref:CAM kinase, SNF1 family n=1 Tax=Neospora caninum (strain Liverpool) TaxID=572307 RepID=F0VNS5_NEOCL|nr:hypothetical protein NCLIV_057940 [Neospora caninum Liverpool]CBZ55371.1 hypothetical protein NCLIV_057940 [Neospora caninum Liverpool]CEL70107.1 TPA: CAM kinase, SNF1 family [Neospora caninum Liverpool]|eukprot:XP_003885399.1 hypothetical protein NCLIV_057940 [Neospora caninum Liverpool]
MEKFFALLGKRLPLPLATRVTKYVSFELEGFYSALSPPAYPGAPSDVDLWRKPSRVGASPPGPGPGVSAPPLAAASSEERNLLELVSEVPGLLAGGARPGVPHAGDHGFDPQGFYLLCWKEKTSTAPKFKIPLAEARLVNNITEQGPCVYIIASNGEYEFQCSEARICNLWLETLQQLGCRLLKFTDLYRLTDFIGEGSFAKVYIGVHLFTGEKVVVKAINKKKVLESNVYTEIEVLRKVLHPYILRLYAAYEQEDYVCLVLEYLRGGELFDYLSEKGPVTEDQARQCMRRLLLALQCLHSKGVVHRDLKTENLILEAPDNPTTLKLIDFGLASTLGSPSMRMRCGSPGYVAPEILQDLPYGTKVDVFSAGIILYTLIAGFTPFRGANVKEILKKNLRCQLNFTHHRWGNVTHSLKDLVAWMCCRNPEKRCAASQALTHPWFHKVQKPLPTPLSPASVCSSLYPQLSPLSGANSALASERASVSTGPESAAHSHRAKESACHVGRRKSGREAASREGSDVGGSSKIASPRAPSPAASSWRDHGLSARSAQPQEKRSEGGMLPQLSSRGVGGHSTATQQSLYEGRGPVGYRAFSASQARPGKLQGARDRREEQARPLPSPPSKPLNCKKEAEAVNGNFSGESDGLVTERKRRGSPPSSADAGGTAEERRNTLCSSLEKLPSSVENQPTLRDSCQPRPSPRRIVGEAGNFHTGEESSIHGEDASFRDCFAKAPAMCQDVSEQPPSTSKRPEQIPPFSPLHPDLSGFSAVRGEPCPGSPCRVGSRESSVAVSVPAASSSAASPAASAGSPASGDASPPRQEDGRLRRPAVKARDVSPGKQDTESPTRAQDETRSTRGSAGSQAPARAPEQPLSCRNGVVHETAEEVERDGDARDRGRDSACAAAASFESGEGGRNGDEADRKPTPPSGGPPCSSTTSVCAQASPLEEPEQQGDADAGGTRMLKRTSSHASCGSSTTVGLSIAMTPLTPAMAPGRDGASQVSSPLWLSRSEAPEETGDRHRQAGADGQSRALQRRMADLPKEASVPRGGSSEDTEFRNGADGAGDSGICSTGLQTSGECRETDEADERGEPAGERSQDKAPASADSRQGREGKDEGQVALSGLLRSTGGKNGDQEGRNVQGEGEEDVRGESQTTRGAEDSSANQLDTALITGMCPPSSSNALHAPSAPSLHLSDQFHAEVSCQTDVPSPPPLCAPSGGSPRELHEAGTAPGGEPDSSALVSSALSLLPSSSAGPHASEIGDAVLRLADKADFFRLSAASNSTAENSPSGPRAEDIAGFVTPPGAREGVVPEPGMTGESETWLALSQQVDLFRPLASAGSECRMHDSCAFEHLPSLPPNTLLPSFFRPPHAEAILNRNATSFDQTSLNPHLFLPYRKGESADLDLQRSAPVRAEDLRGQEERFFQLLEEHLGAFRPGAGSVGNGGKEGEEQDVSSPSRPLDDGPLLQFLRTPQGPARLHSLLQAQRQAGAAPDRQPLSSSPLPVSTFSVHNTSVCPLSAAAASGGDSATREAGGSASPCESADAGGNDSGRHGRALPTDAGLNFLCSPSQGVPVHASSSPPLPPVSPRDPNPANASRPEGFQERCPDACGTSASAAAGADGRRREVGIGDAPLQQSEPGAVVLRSPHHGEDGTKTSQLGVAFGRLGLSCLENGGADPLDDRDGREAAARGGLDAGRQSAPEEGSQPGGNREEDTSLCPEEWADAEELPSEARDETEPMSSVVGDSSFLAACATGIIKDSRKPKRSARGGTPDEGSAKTPGAGREDARQRSRGDACGGDRHSKDTHAPSTETGRRNPSVWNSPPLPPLSPHSHVDRTVAESRPGRSWLWRRPESGPASPSQYAKRQLSPGMAPSSPPGVGPQTADQCGGGGGALPSPDPERLPMATAESASRREGSSADTAPGRSSSEVSPQLSSRELVALSLCSGSGEGSADREQPGGVPREGPAWAARGGRESEERQHGLLREGGGKGPSRAGPERQSRLGAPEAYGSDGAPESEEEAARGRGRAKGESGLGKETTDPTESPGPDTLDAHVRTEALQAKRHGETSGDPTDGRQTEGAHSPLSVSGVATDHANREVEEPLEHAVVEGQTQLPMERSFSGPMAGGDSPGAVDRLDGKRLTKDTGASRAADVSTEGEGQEGNGLGGEEKTLSSPAPQTFPSHAAPRGQTQSPSRAPFLQWNRRHLVASALSPSLAKRATRPTDAVGSEVSGAPSERPKSLGDRGFLSQAGRTRSDKREDSGSSKQGRAESASAFSCLSGGKKQSEKKETPRRWRRERRGASSRSSHSSVPRSACSHGSERDDRVHAGLDSRGSFLDDDRRCSCFASNRSSVSSTGLSPRRKRSTAAFLWSNLTGGSSGVGPAGDEGDEVCSSRAGDRKRSYGFRWRFSFVSTWSTSRVHGSHYVRSDGSSASLAKVPPLPSSASCASAASCSTFSVAGQGETDACASLRLAQAGSKERQKPGSRRGSEKSRRHRGFLDSIMRGRRTVGKEKRTKQRREDAPLPGPADQGTQAGGWDADEVNALRQQECERRGGSNLQMREEERDERGTEEPQRCRPEEVRKGSGSSCSEGRNRTDGTVRGASRLSSGREPSGSCASSEPASSLHRRRSNASVSSASETLDGRASCASRTSQHTGVSWKGSQVSQSGRARRVAADLAARRASIATVYSHADSTRSATSKAGSRRGQRRHSAHHADAALETPGSPNHANSIHGRLGDFLSSSSIFAKLASAVGARDWITGKRRAHEGEDSVEARGGGEKRAREDHRRGTKEGARRGSGGKRDSYQRGGTLGSEGASSHHRGSSVSEQTCEEERRRSLGGAQPGGGRKATTLWEDWYDGEAFFQDAQDAWGPEEEKAIVEEEGSRHAKHGDEPEAGCVAQSGDAALSPQKMKLVTMDSKNSLARRQSAATATTADFFSSSSCSSDFTYVEGLEYARRERGSLFLWSSAFSSSFSSAYAQANGAAHVQPTMSAGGAPSQKPLLASGSRGLALAEETLERKRRGEEAVRVGRGRRVVGRVNSAGREVEVRRGPAPQLVEEKLHGTSFLSFFDDPDDRERDRLNGRPRQRKRHTRSPPALSSRRSSGDGSERLRASEGATETPEWRHVRGKGRRVRTRCKRYGVESAEDGRDAF